MTHEFVMEAKNLHKSFTYPRKITILKDISLSVNKGETISIVGASGSGKSTLLHILGTLETPTSGELSFFGKPVTEAEIPELRNKRIGFVFQMGNLLEEKTLLENVLIKAKIAREPTGPKKSAHEEALFLLDRVGLYDRIDFPVKYLSGGEKQRATIARALMNNPSLILADEPTGNLDALSGQTIQNILISTCKELGKSLIVVTHDLHFADLCDRKCELHEGILVE